MPDKTNLLCCSKAVLFSENVDALHDTPQSIIFSHVGMVFGLNHY